MEEPPTDPQTRLAVDDAPVVDRAQPKRGRKKKSAESNGATIGFEASLWTAADKLRSNMDAAEYKHITLGLLFLKYISDAFEERRAELEAEAAEGADPEEKDEYIGAGAFWVPPEARWATLQANAKQGDIGKQLDDAMVAIERENPRLKNVLPKDYGRPAYEHVRFGELIDLIAGIPLIDLEHRSKDLLGRVYEYFLGQFASAEGRRAGSSTRRGAWSRSWCGCSRRTGAGSTTRAAARAGCSCRARGSSRRTAAGGTTSASTARSRT